MIHGGGVRTRYIERETCHYSVVFAERDMIQFIYLMVYNNISMLYQVG